MTLSVTSWFIGETLKPNLEPIRKLYIDTASDTADLSHHVIRWPTIRHKANMLRPNNISVRLANTDGSLNYLHNDRMMMRRQAEIQLGFKHVDSDTEMINVFAGEVTRVQLKHGDLQVYFTDIWDELTRKLVGTDEDPLDWTGSEYNPADMIWWLCTSFGGLDATTNSSNPDIDWLSFDSFWDQVDADTILMQGHVADLKVSECIKRISAQLDTVAFVDETNRLTFKRFTVAETNVTSLTDENVILCNIEIDEGDMINRQYVNAAFDVESKTFEILVEDTSTYSVNSFGLSEEIYKDESFWHVNSASAISLAQRKTLLFKEPFTKIDVATSLVPITRTIGETIQIQNELYDIAGGYRLMEKITNLDTGRITVKGDRTTFLSVFTLDFASLDSNYILT